MAMRITTNASKPAAKSGQRKDRKLMLKAIQRKLWEDRQIYLMILPVVVYYLLFRYWPMLWLGVSFYDFKILKGFDGSAFVGLKHFIRFFQSPDFLNLIKNTLSINFLALLFVFPMPILFAVMLNEISASKFKKTVQTVSYLPHFISTVAFVGLIINFLSPSTGLLAIIARAMGKSPVYYLGDPRYFRTILVLSGIWQGTGWSAIIYLSSLTNIDQSLYEAAMVDGASRMQRIWHITLPGIAGTIVVMLVLQVGNLLSTNFEKVYLLQNTANLPISEVLQTYIYKRGILKVDYSYSTAVGMFNSFVSVLLVVMANKFSRKISETSLW